MNVMDILFKEAIKLKIKQMGVCMHDAQLFKDSKWATGTEFKHFVSQSLFVDGHEHKNAKEKAWMLAQAVDTVRGTNSFDDWESAFYHGGNVGQANINSALVIPGIYTYKKGKWYNEQGDIVYS